jgi:NAD(P)-dependent dehydrogenase (short-subunit alcohol dehydrogenase family)
MADRNFEGRVAVITGAGRGLGREYARLLGSKGAKVVVNDPGASSGASIWRGRAESDRAIALGWGFWYSDVGL